MFSKLAKALLVSTSFAPVLLSYSFVLFLEEESFKIIIMPIAIAIFLVIVCIYFLERAKRDMQIICFPINSIKTADGEVLGFLAAYLLPFITLTSNQINTIILMYIFTLFFVIIWTTNSYHVNPIITLLGYHFYEVTTISNITFLLITKKDLVNTSNIKNVVQLTEYMVLDIEEVEKRV